MAYWSEGMGMLRATTGVRRLRMVGSSLAVLAVAWIGPVQARDTCPDGSRIVAEDLEPRTEPEAATYADATSSTMAPERSFLIRAGLLSHTPGITNESTRSSWSQPSTMAPSCSMK